MTSTVLLSMTAVAVVHTGTARAQPEWDTMNYYAAIAYSQSTGRYGYSHGFSAEVNGRRLALQNCKAADCKVVLVVGNGYAALALGDDRSAYGFGHSKTEQGADVARRYALEACKKRTTNCKVVVSIHSWAG